MTNRNPWARHYQIAWENRAADGDLPMWLRVACYAYARHEANGHANFGRGQLTWMLGKPPKDGQPFRKASPQAVYDAIQLAVKHGWLAKGSCSECLVVPAHEIEGPNGNPYKPCAVHERKTKRPPTVKVALDLGEAIERV